MTEHAIETHGLTVYYGKRPGIIDVDMQVQPGEVFGFLGPNGAGKTTTLRALLDIIRPSRGSAKIFGHDCQRAGVQARQSVGYLPGELSLPDNLTANTYLNMLAATRNITDTSYLRSLCQRLDLDITRKLRQYSRGNKQKVGLVAALFHRPKLLILDEPTSGLDPLIQQTVLDIVRETQAEGRTVFFSSHILPEVQAVCSRVGIIRAGRVVATETVETLTRQQFRRLQLTFTQAPPAAIFAIEGVTETNRTNTTITLEVQQNLPQVLQLAAQHQLTDIETLHVSLEDVFMAYYGRANHHNGGENHA